MSPEKTRAVVCDRCGRLISAGDAACPYCGASRLGSGFGLRVRAWLRDRGVSQMIFWANIIIYIIGLALTGSAAFHQEGVFNLLGQSNEVHYFLGALFTENITIHHEYWRFITHGFLHVGLLHIAMNMMSLRQLGPFIESEFGPTRFAIIYIGSVITGGLAVVLLNSNAAGASGAIFGLLGAGLALGMRVGGMWGQFIREQFWQSVVWGAIISFAIPGISWQGHAGGFAGGFALGYLLSPQIRRSASRLSEPPFISALGGIMLILVPVAFAANIIKCTLDMGYFPNPYGQRSTGRAVDVIDLGDVGANGWYINVPGRYVDQYYDKSEGTFLTKYSDNLELAIRERNVPDEGLGPFFANIMKNYKILEPLEIAPDRVDGAYREVSQSASTRFHARDLHDGRLLIIEWRVKDKNSERPPDAELMEKVLSTLRKKH